MVSVRGGNGTGTPLPVPPTPYARSDMHEPEEVTAARYLRRSTERSPIPLTLACDRQALDLLQAAGPEKGWARLWDTHIVMRVDAARHAILDSGFANEHTLAAMGVVANASASHSVHAFRAPFLWKLLALCASPYAETVFVDNDVLIMKPGLVDDLLGRSLLLSDLTLVQDPGRPASVRSVSAARKRKHSRQYGRPVSDPDMYAHGIPPLCTCLMAYRRTASVERVLISAAVRLLLHTNPIDEYTGLRVRQSDQEMIWFQLATTPADRELRLLVLPEEYACPAWWPSGRLEARNGDSPFHVYVKAISKGQRPTWTTRFKEIGYDCFATHVHHSHAHLVGAQPPVSTKVVAAFERAVGRTLPRTGAAVAVQPLVS